MYFFDYKMDFFPSKIIIKKSRSILRLFRKGKTRIKAKFHRTDLVICSHSRKGKTSSYSQINTVNRDLAKHHAVGTVAPG